MPATAPSRSNMQTDCIHTGPASEPTHKDYWGGFRVINGMWCASPPLFCHFRVPFCRLVLCVTFLQHVSSSRSDVQGKDREWWWLLQMPAAIRARPRALGCMHVTRRALPLLLRVVADISSRLFALSSPWLQVPQTSGNVRRPEVLHRARGQSRCLLCVMEGLFA